MSEEHQQALKVLARLNQIQLKAFGAKNFKELSFIIVNDTNQLVNNDRAIFWKREENTFEVVNISGQAEFSKTSSYHEQIHKIVHNLKDPSKPQYIRKNSFEKSSDAWNRYNEEYPENVVYWFPLKDEDDHYNTALWIESWNGKSWSNDEIELLSFLGKSYVAALAKFKVRFIPRKFLKATFLAVFIFLFIMSFFIEVRLRVVAPCEVVPTDPYVITTPLDGKIESITVDHGQKVLRGDLLFSYDNKLPAYQLDMERKELEISLSNLERAQNKGYEDVEALKEMETLRLLVNKELLDVDLGSYQFEKLEVRAPINGLIEMKNPKEWRGKQVVVGEKVLTIFDENKTHVEIEIPHNDRIAFDWDIPVKVFLNVSPELSHQAQLRYISSYTTVSDNDIVVFLGEADWEDPVKVKLGLKGTAVLYGEKVTLIYWLMRKPMNTFRELTGI
jgi:HlyD family secretion protein/Biotin-lipoyl like